MPLFIGIPFTLLLVGVTLALSWVVNLNLSLVLIGATTAWAAWDARRLEVLRYRTQLALPTFPLAAVLFIAWPIAFPWYLRVRYLIREGKLAEARGPRRIGVAGVVFIVLFTGALVGGWLLVRSMVGPLLPVAGAVADSTGLQPRVSLNNGRVLVLTFAEPPDSGADREAIARTGALAAMASYDEARSLDRIEVVFMRVSRRGMVTRTRTLGHYAWTPRELEGWAAERATALEEDS